MTPVKVKKAIIYNNVNILDIANRLGIQQQRNGNYNCVNANHKDNTASMGIDGNKNLFHCFGCGIAGKQIKLVEIVKHYTQKQAIDWLFSNFNLESYINIPKKRKSNIYKNRAAKWRGGNGYIPH